MSSPNKLRTRAQCGSFSCLLRSGLWCISDDERALAAQPPTDELMDAARQELSRGWKFIKDAAGEWDARAADALTEAGAIVAVPT